MDNTNVPGPDFVNVTPLAPLDITPDSVKTSLVAFAMLMVLVPLTTLLLFNVIPPLQILFALALLSKSVAPLRKLIVFAIFRDVPLAANVAPEKTLVVLLPKPELCAATNEPELTLVVPV